MRNPKRTLTKMARTSLILMPTVLLLGCSTALTLEGSNVQIVDDKSSCEFLGTVTGFQTGGGSMDRNTDSAMNDLRNEAAQMGANAIKMIDVDVVPQGTTALGEALICTFE
ncbi:MAG: DUF4156 domain-containing protein [Woeseiaceae bacterium]|nr:DUF4156 domain-containing protein [Woeseiaceae bacterium]